jgi:hypothetical protein
MYLDYLFRNNLTKNCILNKRESLLLMYVFIMVKFYKINKKLKLSIILNLIKRACKLHRIFIIKRLISILTLENSIIYLHN